MRNRKKMIKKRVMLCLTMALMMATLLSLGVMNSFAADAPSSLTANEQLTSVLSINMDGVGSGTEEVVFLVLLIVISVLMLAFMWTAGIREKLYVGFDEPELEEIVEDEVVEAQPVQEIPHEEIHYVHEVSAEEVDELMSDQLAAEVLEESVKFGGTGKLGIVNIRVLQDAFEAGDVVTLAALKDKNIIDSRVGRLKVLASGSLDKPLTVEADAFSMQAIKMIILTGGHAVKLKNPTK